MSPVVTAVVCIALGIFALTVLREPIGTILGAALFFLAGVNTTTAYIRRERR